MKRMGVAGIVFACGSGAALGQCGQAEASAHRPALALASHESAPADIVETAVAAGNFKTLAAALQAAGLVETLKGKGPFTVFAPTDEAFAKLPAGTVETLLKPENKAMLTSVLTYHVIPGAVRSKDVRTMPAATVNGQRVELKAEGGKVWVDGATVVMADVAASNGVIHAIDRVIMPSDKPILATAAGAGKFKTLVMLIEKAGLTGALSGAGPFTVFAPTDEAFAKLPKETVEMLLKPEGKETLTKILTYHVVSGRVFSETVTAKGWAASTLQGTELASAWKDGKPWVGGAGFVMTDVDASNGVIHAIDTVLMPK